MGTGQPVPMLLLHGDVTGLAGVSLDHQLGMVALAPALGIAWLGPPVIRRLGERGWMGASQWWAGFVAASPATRWAAGLMLITGVVHLALVPTHLDLPFTALLFLIDGVAFYVIALLAFTWRRWRWIAVPLLVGTIVAYLFYVDTGREQMDQLGTTTKLIELAALGLALVPERSVGRARWVTAAIATVGLTACSGVASWGGSLAHESASVSPVACPELPRHEPGGNAVMQPVPCAATQDQQAAAAQLAAQTRADIAPYASLAVAERAGYRPTGSLDDPEAHVENQRFLHDGRVLDPKAPEALVYTRTQHHGMVLLGAMYEMEKPGVWGPDVGGALTPWHYHRDICISLTPVALSLMTPYGGCPPGAVLFTSNAMLHVWTIPNPIGAYGDLDQHWLARLRAS